MCPMSPCDSNSRTALGIVRELPWSFLCRSQHLPVVLLEHVRRRFCVDLCRLDLGVAEKLLDLLKRHPPLKKERGHRMPEKVRIDSLAILAFAAFSFTIC